jgi:hypothetical protein
VDNPQLDGEEGEDAEEEEEDLPIGDIHTLVKEMQDGLNALKGQAVMRTFTAENGVPSYQSDLDRMAAAAAQAI